MLTSSVLPELRMVMVAAALILLSATANPHFLWPCHELIVFLVLLLDHIIDLTLLRAFKVLAVVFVSQCSMFALVGDFLPGTLALSAGCRRSARRRWVARCVSIRRKGMGFLHTPQLHAPVM